MTVICHICGGTLPLCLNTDSDHILSRYFRGDTELHDLDSRLLERMPETALRCLGVSHRTPELTRNSYHPRIRIHKSVYYSEKKFLKRLGFTII